MGWINTPAPADILVPAGHMHWAMLVCCGSANNDASQLVAAGAGILLQRLSVTKCADIGIALATLGFCTDIHIGRPAFLIAVADFRLNLTDHAPFQLAAGDLFDLEPFDRPAVRATAGTRAVAGVPRTP